MDSGVSEEHAHVYSEAVRRGSTLVSVRADESRSGEIELLLNGYQPLIPTASALIIGRRAGKPLIRMPENSKPPSWSVKVCGARAAHRWNTPLAIETPLPRFGAGFFCLATVGGKPISWHLIKR